MPVRGIFLFPLLKIRRMSVAIQKRATRMVCSASNIPMCVSCHCAVNIQPLTRIVRPREEIRLVHISLPGVLQKFFFKINQTSLRKSSLRDRLERNYCRTHVSLVWRLQSHRQQKRNHCPHTKLSLSVSGKINLRIIGGECV